jgi:hypothetical protein
MDLEVAKRLTRKLWVPESSGGRGSELEWAIAQTLAQQFAEEPRATHDDAEEGVAWLLYEGSLYRGESRTACGQESDGFELRAWSLEGADWRVSLESHGARLTSGDSGLVTKWAFTFADQVVVSVQGEVVLADGAPDEAERFARLLAGSLGWSALA